MQRRGLDEGRGLVAAPPKGTAGRKICLVELWPINGFVWVGFVPLSISVMVMWI